MEQRLKLVFQDPHLASACKAILFAGALAFVARAHFGVFPIALAALFVLYLYRRSGERGAHMRGALTILFIVSIVVTYMLSELGSRFLFYLSAAGVFYAMLCVREFLFTRRSEWNYALRLAISYFIFLMLLLSEASAHFPLIMLLAFFAFYILWKEFFKNSEAGEQVSPYHVYNTSASVLIALCAAESLWFGKLLPLGIMSAANLSFLVTFAVSGLVMRHIESRLTVRYMLSIITFFIFAVIVIFIFSRWSV
jgi:hypothetical protein